MYLYPSLPLTWGFCSPYTFATVLHSSTNEWQTYSAGTFIQISGWETFSRSEIMLPLKKNRPGLQPGLNHKAGPTLKVAYSNGYACLCMPDIWVFVFSVEKKLWVLSSFNLKRCQDVFLWYTASYRTLFQMRTVSIAWMQWSRLRNPINSVQLPSVF